MIDIYFLQNDFEIDELRFQRDEVIGAKVVSVLDMLTLVSKMEYRPKEDNHVREHFIKPKLAVPYGGVDR